jgi:hypothetical protein
VRLLRLVVSSCLLSAHFWNVRSCSVVCILTHSALASLHSSSPNEEMSFWRLPLELSNNRSQ